MGRPPGASWAWLPVALTLAALFTAGLALLLSSLTVFFRDLRHLVEVLFQVWFYLTPVFYPASFLGKLSLGPVRACSGRQPGGAHRAAVSRRRLRGAAPAPSTLALAAPPRRSPCSSA